MSSQYMFWHTLTPRFLNGVQRRIRGGKQPAPGVCSINAKGRLVRVLHRSVPYGGENPVILRMEFRVQQMEDFLNATSSYRQSVAAHQDFGKPLQGSAQPVFQSK